jgi:hypothetical protein
MKLITEEVTDVEFITEEKNGKKSMYIEGIFLQAEIKNRNGRCYPYDTLINEVNRYVTEKVNKNMALGELGHPCLSGDARILTVSNGWKHIQDCSKDELVYTINPETKEVESHPIKKVIINAHNGFIYTLKNRGINTRITPDHRFLIFNSRNDNEYKFVTAQEIYNDLNSDNQLSKWYIPKYSLGLKKETPEYFEIPRSKTLKAITEKTEKYLEDLKIEFKTFAAFLGIYLAEGHCSERTNGSYSVGLSQKEGEKSEKISELLHSMEGLVWNESFYENKIIWTCYDRRLGEYLHQFGKCYDKYVDKTFIEQLDGDTARIFIDYFVLGDGRGSVGGRCDCFSTSEQLMDDLAQIATIAGIGVSRYQEDCENDYEFAGRTIRAENRSTLYFCRFLTTKGIYLDKRYLEISSEEWNDNVYCIQVENTNFMVEQGGYTYWTGNCGPTVNLDRVSHMIVSLLPEGNNVIGKAKILENTPMGKIAAALISEGVRLGVSSRGIGSLVERNGVRYVSNDFMLSTAADIVADPSAPEAFVNGIYEGVEWIYDTNRKAWIAESIRNLVEKDIISKRLTEERKLEHFRKFLDML